MRTSKLEFWLPIFAIALAVLGAFASNSTGGEETGLVIGYYDSDYNGTCDMETICSYNGPRLCTDITGLNPAYMNTDCTIQLYAPPY